MRILHVDPERGWGGGEVQVLGLVRELEGRGHACELAVDPRGRLAQVAQAEGWSVRALRIRNHADVRAGWRLRRLARGVDVVHFHTARAHALAPCLLGTPARRIVTRRMDYVPRGGPYARLLYGRMVDGVIAISDGVRRALLTAGVPASAIRVVPSAVDPARVQVEAGTRERVRGELAVGRHEVLVLGVGALERRKGFDLLIDALAARGEPRMPVRLVLAGDGSQADRLRAQAASVGVRLDQLGFRSDVGGLLAAADLVVLPSRAEGLGVAALEAMAAGRALIATRVGGLTEVVEDGVSGVLVPPEDVPALSRAVASLGAAASERERLGRAGQARVARRFSMTAMAEGTLACYGERP